MMVELIDTDLEAVAGGFVFPFSSPITQTLTQTNTVNQTATAGPGVLPGGGANTAINAIGVVGNSASQFAV